tara:strand:+ start:244 stop:495 length:252 start_codon:yes stop_codon:yes gene_type:complete
VLVLVVPVPVVEPVSSVPVVEPVSAPVSVVEYVEVEVTVEVLVVALVVSSVSSSPHPVVMIASSARLIAVLLIPNILFVSFVI